VGAKWWWGAPDGHHSAIISKSLVKSQKSDEGLLMGARSGGHRYYTLQQCMHTIFSPDTAKFDDKI